MRKFRRARFTRGSSGGVNARPNVFHPFISLISHILHHPSHICTNLFGLNGPIFNFPRTKSQQRQIDTNFRYRCLDYLPELVGYAIPQCYRVSLRNSEFVYLIEHLHYLG